MSTLIINPNSTEAMTVSMTEAARAAEPSLRFEGWTSHEGPAAIEGPADGAAAEGPLLSLVAQAGAADGIIIGCFDDTALADAARLAPCPVLGLGQAAFHHCALRQWRFGVVTTMAVSVPVIEQNIAAYGLWDHTAGVRASGVPVLALEREPEAAIAPIEAEVARMIREDKADAVVLGCAGMVNIVAEIRRRSRVPVIDTVEAAATGMKWLQSGLRSG